MTAQLFAENVKLTCSPNSPDKDLAFRCELDRRVSSFNLGSENVIFDTELVAMAMSKIKKGKSADYDGLTAEHFIFAHPCQTVITSKLFNLMLQSGFVPDGFGKELSFMIPKASQRIKSATTNDFRVITICPVIFKIFEHCVLIEIEDKLVTCSRQFGFKKHTSCSHANFLFKETVDYFTHNESNVCIASLDLSKAFDKINHAGLFLKLLDRGYF